MGKIVNKITAKEGAVHEWNITKVFQASFS